MTTSRDAAIDLRLRMVADQIAARGVRGPRLLGAMAEVPRERFMPGASLSAAYDDGAHTVGFGQTISQPYMVARMLDLCAVQAGARVLEVGTGMGYQAAILSKLAGEVVTVERIEELAARARSVLADLGCANVFVVVGDGSLGWPDRAPYGAIVVAAGAPAVPTALTQQLAGGGRLVVPVGPRGEQVLVRVLRTPRGLEEERFDRCVFVPLLGEQGFPE